MPRTASKREKALARTGGAGQAEGLARRAALKAAVVAHVPVALAPLPPPNLKIPEGFVIVRDELTDTWVVERESVDLTGSPPASPIRADAGVIAVAAAAPPNVVKVEVEVEVSAVVVKTEVKKEIKDGASCACLVRCSFAEPSLYLRERGGGTRRPYGGAGPRDGALGAVAGAANCSFPSANHC